MSGPVIQEFRDKCLLLSFDLISSGWINNYLIIESEVVTGKCQTTCRIDRATGSLRSYDGNCNENVTLKLNFALSEVFCDYSISVTLYKIGGVLSLIHI